MVGRWLKPRESNEEPFLTWLEGCAWAVRTLKRYALYSPEVCVSVPESKYLLVACDCLATKVRALMIELSMYKVRWEVGDAPLAQFAMEECCRGPGEFKVPHWEHEGDVDILRKAEVSIADVGAAAEGAAIAYFDGGAAGKLGAGGYALFGGDGVCLFGRGSWYATGARTNNKAEASALFDLVTAVSRAPPEGVRTLVVYGDSRLVVDFMNRAAKPGKPSLYVLV